MWDKLRWVLKTQVEVTLPLALAYGASAAAVIAIPWITVWAASNSAFTGSALAAVAAVVITGQMNRRNDQLREDSRRRAETRATAVELQHRFLMAAAQLGTNAKNLKDAATEGIPADILFGMMVAPLKPIPQHIAPVLGFLPSELVDATIVFEAATRNALGLLERLRDLNRSKPISQAHRDGIAEVMIQTMENAKQAYFLARRTAEELAPETP